MSDTTTPSGSTTPSVRRASEFSRDVVGAGKGTVRQVLIGDDQGPNFALRRFIMEPGGGMPRHTNTVEHEQYVLRGRATIGIGSETFTVSADDVVYIPAGVPHWYRAEGDTPFEFLCVVPNLEDRIELVPEEGAPGGTDADAC
jgi:quercetin dioxygenase-like cupin family protein